MILADARPHNNEGPGGPFPPHRDGLNTRNARNISELPASNGRK
jgi:hypothetical protein